jgi:hypothetical protein
MLAHHRNRTQRQTCSALAGRRASTRLDLNAPVMIENMCLFSILYRPQPTCT